MTLVAYRGNDFFNFVLKRAQATRRDQLERPVDQSSEFNSFHRTYPYLSTHP
jgi:hypothetical protein